MTDEQALRDALNRRYVVEVEYTDEEGGTEIMSAPLPLWGCMNWAQDNALHFYEHGNIYYVLADDKQVMKYSLNRYKDYAWSIVDDGNNG